jgi:serine/threonine-protein kinase
MSDNLIGKNIGGYEILNQIGQGGMATVYRAQQLSMMNRIVALKVLPRHLLNDDTYIQRFNQEVKIVAQLEHRNIVPVYDYGQHDGQPYIVMRFMPAGSIDDLLRKGPLDIETTLSIVEQIAPALDYAHGKSILHRDLKPSNVLLDNDGGAYITDFGIARILGETGPGITTQGVVGTPSYMSPEQAQAHPLDGRSDIYALGVMLFEMVTGRRPFESDTPYSIAVMQVTQPPPAPRNLNPDVPQRVEHVILRALKKNREERHATAGELSDSLRDAIENPVKISDTQPHPVFVAPVPQTIMQPPPQPAPSPVIPSQPYAPPPYTTAAPQSGYIPTPSQVYPNWRGRMKKRTRGNMWLSVMFGALIGCALLTVVVVIAAIAINSFTNPGTSNATPHSTDGGDNSASFVGTDTPEPSPLEQTSIAGRQTLIPNRTTDATTPLPTNGLTDVGVRPTATFSPLLDDARGTVLFFGKDEDSFEIFMMDIQTRIRTQLTSDTDVSVNSYAAPSPDGQWIAFQSDRDGDFEIYVVNRLGGQLRKLTDNDVLDRIPSWSPDGEWIIYSTDIRNDGNFDIYKMRADGSEKTEVFSNGQRNSHPRYSPDGRYIAFTSGQSRAASTWEILLLDTQTGQVAQVTDNSTRDASPVFNPDGTHMLYISYGEGYAAISRMDLDGGNKQVIYDSPGYEWEASYSPDGHYIVFNNDITGRDELYLMTADGIEAQLITDEGGTYPFWMD